MVSAAWPSPRHVILRPLLWACPIPLSLDGLPPPPVVRPRHRTAGAVSSVHTVHPKLKGWGGRPRFATGLKRLLDVAVVATPCPCRRLAVPLSAFYPSSQMDVSFRKGPTAPLAIAARLLMPPVAIKKLAAAKSRSRAARSLLPPMRPWARRRTRPVCWRWP